MGITQSWALRDCAASKTNLTVFGLRILYRDPEAKHLPNVNLIGCYMKSILLFCSKQFGTPAGY